MVKRIGTAFVLLVLGCSALFAQTSTATVLGVVRDTSGALIPGVTVNVKHIETGLTRTVISSETGNYSVRSLPIGPYEITTTMPGFKQEVRRGINLGVGQEAVIDLTLEVGANAEQVTVSEEAPLVNTTLASTAGFLRSNQRLPSIQAQSVRRIAGWADHKEQGLPVWKLRGLSATVG